jgi:hypothetical protein
VPGETVSKTAATTTQLRMMMVTMIVMMMMMVMMGAVAVTAVMTMLTSMKMRKMGMRETGGRGFRMMEQTREALGVVRAAKLHVQDWSRKFLSHHLLLLWLQMEG